MSTKVLKTTSEYKNLFSSLAGKTIGFVPTMGALHEGHLTLMRKAKAENDIVVVSVFVNPTQFNNPEDLKKYPRTLDQDLKMISAVGADYLFYPEINEMYPDDYKYKVTENAFSKILCGAHRPGHFDGVLSVVMKLFNIVRPTKAYFGEKDYQQLKLIQGMVESFFMNLEIVPVPIVRDEKGLALSSRNQRLSEEGLERARKFAQIFKQDKTLEDIDEELTAKNIEVEYLEEHFGRKFAAVHIEGVRLIDNT
ncbi:MAG: pantoate--beta-alanine ligase [Bdellovibrionota bacterium]